MLNGLRAATRGVSYAVLSGAMATFGTYTGFRKQCDAYAVWRHTMVEFEFEKQSDREWLDMLIEVVDVAHAFGHVTRDASDKEALKDVMGEFQRAMRRTESR